MPIRIADEANERVALMGVTDDRRGMTPTAVLGIGIMGSAMVRNLLAAGVQTTVWDRSAAVRTCRRRTSLACRPQGCVLVPRRPLGRRAQPDDHGPRRRLPVRHPTLARTPRGTDVPHSDPRESTSMKEDQAMTTPTDHDDTDRH